MYIHRKIEKKLIKYIKVPEIIAVVGSRQVGKTTLLKYIYKNEIKSKKKIFVNFEDKEILYLFDNNIKTFAKLYVEPYNYVFIDEFQYSKNSSDNLKYLYDFYKCKFFISGSSSLDITFKVVSKLVGRIFVFELYPFSFEEYLNYKYPEILGLFKNIFKLNKIDKVIHKKILNIVEDFIIYGGYPRVIVSKDIDEKKEVLKNLFNTYLLKDIEGFFQIASDYSFIRFIKAISTQIGNIINYNELSSISELKYNEVKKFLSILEETYVIKLLKPFYRNKRTEIVKNPKIYFIDTGLRNNIIGNFTDLNLRTDKGELIENFVAIEIIKSSLSIKYWRTKSKAEVDFIIEKNNEKLLPVEVKSFSVKNPGRSILSFIEKYKDNLLVNPENHKTGSIILHEGIIFQKKQSIFYPYYMVGELLEQLKIK